MGQNEISNAAFGFGWGDLSEGMFVELGYYDDDEELMRIGLHRDKPGMTLICYHSFRDQIAGIAARSKPPGRNNRRPIDGPPARNEVVPEHLYLFVIGPGIGETVLLRIPPDQWVVVDSFKCGTPNRPAADSIVSRYGGKVAVLARRIPMKTTTRASSTSSIATAARFWVCSPD